MALVVLAGAGSLLMSSPIAGVHARLDVHNAEHVHVNEPVTVRFDQAVDLKQATVALDPSIKYTELKQRDAFVLTPTAGWEPGKRYTVVIGSVSDTAHKSTLRSWRASSAVKARPAA